MKKFLFACICSGIAVASVAADLNQRAGAQEFVWGENGTLEEYRVNGKLQNAHAVVLFSATDVQSGKSGVFAGTFSPQADGSVLFQGKIPAMELGLQVLFREEENGFLSGDVQLQNLSGQSERAIELKISLPLSGNIWNFNMLQGSDRNSGAVEAEAGREYSELRSIDNPRFPLAFSRLPFGAVDDGQNGIMLAHPMRKPCFARYSFKMERNFGVLSMTVPLGISSSTDKFVNYAPVNFMIGDFPAEQHLRGALRRYHDHSPQLFESHIGYPGAWALWIPEFSMDIARECGMGFNQREWDEDFERGAVEAVKILDASRRNGIKTLLYSEPWSITLPFPSNWYKENEDLSVKQYEDQLPIALGAVKDYIEELKGDDHVTERFAGTLTNDELYQILHNTAFEINENGDWRLNCYWINQFHWGEKYKGQDSGAVIVNPDPELLAPNRSAITYEKARYGFAWQEAGKVDRTFDGFYIDSENFSMGWSECNFRKDHWKVADRPLTFAPFEEDGKVKVFQHSVLAYNDFLEDMRRRADELDYCIAVNTWTHFVSFLVPYGDMIGAGEFFVKDWIAPLADFREFRYLAGRKLITTMDYVLNYHGGVPVTPEGVQQYMEPRLNLYLMYGIFAGTANAWNQQESVKLLIPLMSRYSHWTKLINNAGWEEIPQVKISGADEDRVLIERWGNHPEKGLYFTLRGTPPHVGNMTLQDLAALENCQVTLEWNPEDFRVHQFSSVTELTTGQTLPLLEENGRYFCSLTVPAARTLLLQLH